MEGKVASRRGCLDKSEGRKGKVRKAWKDIKDRGHRVAYHGSRTLKNVKLNNVL